MTRSRNDFERLDPTQTRERLLIEFDNAKIGAADDQQSRCLHHIQRVSSEIGAPATRDHCTDTARKFCCGDERRRRSGAGAEQPKWQSAD